MFYHPNVKTYQICPPTTRPQPRAFPQNPQQRRPTPLQHALPPAISPHPNPPHADPTRSLFAKPLQSLLRVAPRESKILLNDSITNLADMKKTTSGFVHNLSANNLRTTASPFPRSRRELSFLARKRTTPTTAISHFFDLKKPVRKAPRQEEKKCKQAPSFIKNKATHPPISMQDFHLLRSLEQGPGVIEYLALHRKTQAILVLRRYRKAYLLQHEPQLQQLKFDLRNSEISHNMLARNFGFFVDGEFITLVEEFLDGQTMHAYMRQRNEGFTETEIGAKICEVLTAVNFLHSHGFVHGCIDQLNVVNSLNVCKIRRPCLKDQKKDPFFDIWCLGKLAFEMATNSQLVPDCLLWEVNTIDEVFRSAEIAKCIEIGFKRLEGSNYSVDLMQFLINTLWTIQNKELSLQALWDLEFIKLFRQDDIWNEHK